jgi:4-amino-4-deoxy-L-arabinose transferase-like glycosyltransferase
VGPGGHSCPVPHTSYPQLTPVLSSGRLSKRILPVWLAVCALLLAVHLGGHPLLDSDEGRNAEVGREMAETNDYVMPRLNGLPYIDKPIVYFAAAAAAMEVLGPTELAARLPAYLFTLASAAVVFLFARRVWGRGGSSGSSELLGVPRSSSGPRSSGNHSEELPWVAAIVFLSMPLVVAFSRTVIFDSALAFFVTVALTSFYLAIEERNPRWAMLGWLAMGFAMITKGPVTFVLVLFVALPYAWKRKALRPLFPVLGLVVFAVVVAPWVWGVTQVVPEFLRYVLVTETAERVATKALERTAPPWFFIPYLLAGAMPWSFVALANPKLFRRENRRDDPALAYCLLAVAIPFVFFSLSQSKLPQYILPLMAPLALAVARIWGESRSRAAAVIFVILGVFFTAGSFFAHRTKLKPELREVTDEVALAFGIVFLAGGLIALFAKRREVVLIALTVPVIAMPLIANPLLNALAERRSAKSFVAELTPYVTPRTHIIGVEAFSGSLAFYLQRRVTLVTEDASELTSNYLRRRYRKFLDVPGSPLEPLSYVEQSLAGAEPRVYIVRVQDVKWQRLLEARGWRRVADGARHVGYAR